MEKKVVSASTLKIGSYLIIDGAACRVVNIQVSRPGKHGHAKVRLEGIGIIDGKKRAIVMPGHDNVEVPVIGKRNAQVLSIHGRIANVMDSETYETFDLSIPEELRADCVEGCTVVYWQVLNDKIMKQIKAE
jgi:translation initiation factor 5A